MKRLIWIGSSYEDLKDFPAPTRGAIGHALYLAQEGKKHVHAKVLSGMGSAKILEVRENDRSGTYRVIYTIEMDDFVFVLHAFQKKSTSSVATPKHELDLLKSRLREAKALYKSLKKGQNENL
jgi:phage-related protein